MNQPRWRGAALICLLLLVCLGLPASAAQVASMTLGVERQGEAPKTYRLSLCTQGDMARYLVLADSSAGPNGGGYILTRDAGRTWYAINPAKGKCVRWSTQDVAAVLSGFVSRLKDWANLQIDAPSLSRLEESEGGTICGYATRRYSYLATFGFKARVLFKTWRYRISREIEVWVADGLSAFHLRDWLVDAPLRTGHPQLDRLITEELSEMKGVVLKKRVRETVTDKDGKITRSELTQTFTGLGQGATPPVFAPDWTPPPCQAQSRDDLEDAIKAILKQE
ncbi:MAG: hypothetical protein ABIK12_04390 [Pseudomonadota bacterium]